jgi:hypothetical protein
MMEAVRTSETSVYTETTGRYIPEGSHLQSQELLTVKHFIYLFI